MSKFTFDGVTGAASGGDSGGGVSGGVQLAPDPLRTDLSSIGYNSIVGVNCTGGLTTLLSLTGKWAIPYLVIHRTSAEMGRMVLTIDGVVIRDITATTNTNGIVLFGLDFADINGGTSSRTMSDIVPICNESLLLEFESTADTSINCFYRAYPIL